MGWHFALSAKFWIWVSLKVGLIFRNFQLGVVYKAIAYEMSVQFDKMKRRSLFFKKTKPGCSLEAI